MTTRRRQSHIRGFLAAIAVAIPAMLVGFGLSGPPAQAAYTVNLVEQGTSVVATGSGSIDLGGLSFTGISAIEWAAVEPMIGLINTGPTTDVTPDVYTGFTGPAGFGSGALFTNANSGSGDLVGMFSGDNLLFVPQGYMSGSTLSDTSTYDNATLASLGVTPGTYEWTWGSSGVTADSFTLQIGAVAVPEPATLLVFALPLGLIVLLAARYRRPARIA